MGKGIEIFSFLNRYISVLEGKKSLFFKFALIVVLMAFTCSGSALADTSPPQLADFSFTPTSLDLSESAQDVVFTFQVTDDSSGFSNGKINLTSPSGEQTYSKDILGTDLKSGNTADGVYQVIVTFPQSSEGGIWHVTSIYLRDAANNEIYYLEPLLITLRYPSTFGIVKVNGEDDTVPPALRSMSFTPTTIETGYEPQKVSFTIRITDNLSGYFGGEIYLRSPSGKQVVCVSFRSANLVSGNSLDGVYQATGTFPQYSETGSWKIELMNAYDNVGNISYYNENDIAQMSFATSIEIMSTPDIVPPALQSLSLTPTEIETGYEPQKVNFTIRITDNLSGYFGGNIYLRSPSGKQVVNVSIVRSANLVSGNSLDGVYQATGTFPQYSETGSWKINIMNAYDNVGNIRYYYENDIAQMGFANSIEVTGTPDIVPPALQSMSFTPTTIETGYEPQKVTFTFRITDNLSGYFGGEIYLRSPSGKQVVCVSFRTANLVSGNSLDGVYQATGTFPQYSESGSWKINIINAYDNVGNIRYYYENDLSQVGLPNTLEVVIPNLAPIALAGDNIFVQSQEIATTSIIGTATDEDQGDTLTYRWVEGQTTLLDWTPVGSNGDCSLNLSPLSLSVGPHTLALEVKDSRGATATDEMVLTISNSAPNAALKRGEGTYQLGEEILLSGEASDFDGDNLSYQWIVGENVVCSGSSVSTVAWGDPILVPDCTVTGLPLGEHVAYLQVSDGINAAVASEVAVVKIIDDTAPTLTPVISRSILWPPNHGLVDITIDSGVADNSGLAVTLSAEVSSNEAQDGLGDGDISPDWFEPMIDQETGIIKLQLRAERSGSGDGRSYTVHLTASDTSGNLSEVDIHVIVPHDQRNK